MDQLVYPETRRLSIQADLDARKTLPERNKFGQFATPTVLAREILAYGLSQLPNNEDIRFLDPAIGTGSFYSALLETIDDRHIATAMGFEVDPHYALPAKRLWKDHDLDIELADFTKAVAPETGFNLLICNPPYVRHHHLNGSDKQLLKARSRIASGMSLSGLSGFYCYFLALSHQWMSVGGVAGWLIPSEFMDVNYGKEVKRYLLEDVTLIRIHRFDPNEIQFSDALVSSAVVWFKKEKPPTGHVVEFTYGGTHSTPALSRHIPAMDLAREPKWTRFPQQEVREIATTPTLSDLFDIRRGIATGSNDFFILSREKIRELKLPMECFHPILPSPRYVDTDEIFADEQGNPLLSRSLFLLDCRLSEDEVKERYPSLWKYLASGKEALQSRYLCKSRPVWFHQEYRAPTPFVCSYMGRSDLKSRKPFRFLLNHSQAIVANTYLMLFPKAHVAEHIHARPNAIREIWKLLNDIPPEALLSEGRVYGGGLHKMEPKELAKVSATEIAKILHL